MSQLHAEDFWQYSVHKYGRPEMKELCLLLQEEWQFNVNLLLLCGWLQSKQLKLEKAHILSLLNVIAVSDNELKTHRDYRRKLQKGTKDYECSLSRELELEGLQQRTIILNLNKSPLFEALIDTETNLSKYFSIMPDKSKTHYNRLNQLLME